MLFKEYPIVTTINCHTADRHEVGKTFHLLIYLLNNWIPRDWAFVGVFTLCFAVGYALIWGIILLSIRHRTNRINRHLRGGKS